MSCVCVVEKCMIYNPLSTPYVLVCQPVAILVYKNKSIRDTKPAKVSLFLEQNCLASDEILSDFVTTMQRTVSLCSYK